ncbi:hypothetical protein MEL_324 [Melbournevirus]|uniref:hypothetical protein n=1 Tax=Melbournevirus TaxID=1560514 RepID=UPI00051F5C7E|nr:hypothetical protein MEL_324 [Melbournevirus]
MGCKFSDIRDERGKFQTLEIFGLHPLANIQNLSLFVLSAIRDKTIIDAFERENSPRAKPRHHLSDVWFLVLNSFFGWGPEPNSKHLVKYFTKYLSERTLPQNIRTQRDACVLTEISLRGAFSPTK